MYIENYKNVKEQFFNFSNEYLCLYDKSTNSLTIKKNPNFIKDFFSKNVSSLSVIAGKNCAGKTTAMIWLLERITSGYATDYGDFDKGGFIVFRKGNNFESQGNSVSLRDETNDLNTTPLHERVSPLYYEGNLNFFNDEEILLHQWDGITNISTKFLLHRDFQNHTGTGSSKNLSVMDHFHSHFWSEQLRIVKFVSAQNNEFSDFFGLKIPPYLFIKPDDVGLKYLVEKYKYPRLNQKNKYSIQDVLKLYLQNGVAAIVYQENFHSKAYNPDLDVFKRLYEKFEQICDFKNSEWSHQEILKTLIEEVRASKIKDVASSLRALLDFLNLLEKNINASNIRDAGALFFDLGEKAEETPIYEKILNIFSAKSFIGGA